MRGVWIRLEVTIIWAAVEVDSLRSSLYPNMVTNGDEMRSPRIARLLYPSRREILNDNVACNSQDLSLQV
jgi:hypothetical protein